tara:strand:- start:747 stop:1415 length:669 start_codon:yes stop_codon:yes gene_type:complete
MKSFKFVYYTSMQDSKMQVAKLAYNFIKAEISDNTVLGIGTGSTTNCFIEVLKQLKPIFKTAVSSSKETTSILKEANIKVSDINEIESIDFYIDGADEVDQNNCLIKGGGGALTREKIVAAKSNKFICIVTKDKMVPILGDFGIPVEVLMHGKQLFIDEVKKLGGKAKVRESFQTDSGNLIIDVTGLKVNQPIKLEASLNMIPGVVENGIFAQVKPYKVITN